MSKFVSQVAMECMLLIHNTSADVDLKWIDWSKLDSSKELRYRLTSSVMHGAVPNIA